VGDEFRLIGCTSLTGVDDLLPLTARFEPASCPVEWPLLERGLGRDMRGWVVETPAGALAGLVLLERLDVDRWVARPLLADPAAGAVAAARIAQSPAWAVLGTAPHVDPVVEHLDRVSRVQRRPFTAVDDPIRLGPPDPRSRLASPADLPALVDLYEGYDTELWPTRTRVRRFLADTLESTFVVVAAEGRSLLGAYLCDARSRATLLWTGLVVVPEARHRGVRRALVDQALALTAACNLAYAAVDPAADVDEPPTGVPSGVETFVTAHLRPRSRFPGHRALRAGEGWIERTLGNRR